MRLVGTTDKKEFLTEDLGMRLTTNILQAKAFKSQEKADNEYNGKRVDAGYERIVEHIAHRRNLLIEWKNNKEI